MGEAGDVRSRRSGGTRRTRVGCRSGSSGRSRRRAGCRSRAAWSSELGLETVCESARCPNRSECWTRRTATFMILGDVCTRPCGFCAVKRGRPEAVALDEPERLAEACQRLGLRHVVITSVTRDDLPDGGAEHFRQCVLAVRRRTGATIEVLTPDFDGRAELDRRRPRRPPRGLQPQPRNRRPAPAARAPQEPVRGEPGGARACQASPARDIRTKSGLMLGLGETTEELFETLADLRSIGCDLLTLGQYLQPSPRHLPVVRYLPPRSSTSWAGMARSARVSPTSPAGRSSARATTPTRWPGPRADADDGHASSRVDRRRGSIRARARDRGR